MDEAALEEAQSRAMVTEKRKAWAKSRDSWQASEAEDVSAEARAVQGKLQLGDSSANIPNEKIAIWLKDCRTPLGASLDEQSTPPGFPKGMILKNGNSFEDDLSLGAEANHLHQRFLPMEPTINGMLAKDRRLQFHQKGRSMNSTGSGKSSATVSSVSELLDLYEEDPEEILYNLGFGRDEPDIASKIPSRFFNNSSFAHGIDIKVFLNAQMQRLELENPNYALTSRFRQIKVLTDVANAFSSLYSHVSGTPLQQIGSSKSLTTSTTVEAKPAPLARSSSQTAVRFMETLSKLNLCGARSLGESNHSAQSLEDKGPNQNGNDDESNKNDQKVLKPFKKTSPPLATVKEEVPLVLNSLVSDTNGLDGSAHPKENGVLEPLPNSNTNGQEQSPANLTECDTCVMDSPTHKDLSVSTDQDCEHYLPDKNPSTSTPERDLCVTNPSISSLLKQDKESFELEELQSAEEEPHQIPPICHLALEKIGKDNLLRTASQHSDSSGFAEDTSGDCLLTSSLPAQDSLQAMGSSADSYDSETTVTSIGEDLRTPLALDQTESIDLDDEFLTPVGLGRRAFFSETELEAHNVITEVQNNQKEELKSSEDLNRAVDDTHDLSEEESDLQQECTADSELETNSEYEAISYTTHHISEELDSFPEFNRFPGLGSSDSRSLDRVNVALQRAQKKIYGSETAESRTGRSMITSKDLLKRRHKYASSGYPLRRTQSLPTPLLSPVKVVSKVNIVLNSGKATVCSPPSFSYKYTPEDEELSEQPEDLNTTSKAMVFTPNVFDTRDAQKFSTGRMAEDHPRRPQSCTAHAPSHRSHSSCSLHSLQSDWHERPLCEHARAWSTHSVPNFPGTCGSMMFPFSCNQRVGYGSLHRSCSGCSLPLNSSPSTTEMQLRRVLHDIRSSIQNLSQHPVMRGQDLTSGGYSQKSSILSLYENTFQELQIMRRSLNLFRTQMMDLELNMLRQQTMVYQHLTEEERYEADQLQGLRNSVRMELQELELQLDERLLTLEEQLRSFHVSSPFQRQAAMVNELIREQSHLKSELCLEDSRLDHGAERCDSEAPSDSSSVCFSPLNKNRKGPLKSSDSFDKPKIHTPPGKTVFRATVALTPSPPTRAGASQNFADESLEERGGLKLESSEKRDSELFPPVAEVGSRWTPEENNELQQVIREIKEAIVGDIRREIVSGLLAAVSSPVRSMDGKNDGRI
ncbi:protein ITPRID2 isoform X2 [Engystomops pustulosus]|uniref:protein ITPRID2 isoform X2 n=1 Tax=Engystomops pustulosus TaxID=76066 RepID=UPI003AFB35F1